MKSASANNVGLTGAAFNFSFQQQMGYQVNCTISKKDTSFHLHAGSLINEMHAAETAIKLIAAKQPGTSFFLCRYLKETFIIQTSRSRSSHQITLVPFEKFTTGFPMPDTLLKHAEYERKFSSKNIRISSGQKAKNLGAKTTTNQHQNKALNFLSNANESDQILSKKTVENKEVSAPDFEGIPYLIDRQIIKQALQCTLTNFLANYFVSFYESEALFIRKQDQFSFYLDRNVVVKKCARQGVESLMILVDRSSVYTAGKCLNERLMLFVESTEKEALEWSWKLYLLQFFL
jgi:hypothetical protein